MINRTVVIDYGAGNLKSITKALKIFGLNTEIINPQHSTFNFVRSADLLVLPGVGEFGSALKLLNRIKDKIIEHIKNGKPLLGICLGIQLLFDKSEESPGKKGLGIIPGKVVKFDLRKSINQLTKRPINKSYLPVPQMCWNKVNFVNSGSENDRKKKSEIIKKLNKEEFFYFVHSYYPVPEEKEVIFGTTVYGKKFCSMIVKDNIIATQFHLEKSGQRGLMLLKNIIRYFERL